MKKIIRLTESDLTRIVKRVINEQSEEIPEFSFKMFNNDWGLLQRFLEIKGNPPYKLIGNLDLSLSDVQSLGNLQHVGGWLDLYGTNIESLGNLQSVGNSLYLGYSKIKSLGNLQSVVGSLVLYNSNIESLGNLQSVGGNLDLTRTPLSKKMTRKEIKSQIEVGGSIYL